ncbi:hypothetical protein CO670_15015 [Rhizobium sp. J15]|uniref:hypothetical protein n=1 Tax=Rhizobium sp. J15 TaxID=2035450 RepID=UPI000BE955B9|nr:hypothetical protein [Rhizobium sp. J15]PDT16090.1 hypothetical protein CO670_15015 [Rhizobium sp. J15]
MTLRRLKDVFGLGCIALQLYIALAAYHMLQNTMSPDEIWAIIFMIAPVGAVSVSTYIRYKFTDDLFYHEAKTSNDERVRRSTAALAVGMIIAIGLLVTFIIHSYVSAGLVTGPMMKVAMVGIESVTGGGLPVVAEFLFKKRVLRSASPGRKRHSGDTAVAQEAADG